MSVSDYNLELDDLDITINDGLDELDSSEVWDEDHALDMVMNDMVADFTDEDIKEISMVNENPPKPEVILSDAAEVYKDVTSVIEVDTIIDNVISTEIVPVPSIMQEVKKPGQVYTEEMAIADQKKKKAISRKQETDSSTKRGKFNKFGSSK